jgi:type IV fimbrial biogenesis protein FimT
VLVMKRRPCFTSRRCARGLTLIELMTVVALLGILAALAAPGMNSFLVGQRVTAMTYDLTADLLLARSEALKRGLDVSVTPAADGWTAGWSVAVGGNEVGGRLSAGSGLVFEDAPDEIVFNRNGRISAPADVVRITIRTEADGGRQRCVELDLSGRARATAAACT